MGYFKRNIVPGHYRGDKKGKMRRNPGYDVNPFSAYGTRAWIRIREGGLLDSWYKPKGAPTRRGNKRGQSKPR